MTLEEAIVLVNWGCILTRPGAEGFLGRGTVPHFLQYGLKGGYRNLSPDDITAKDWYVLGGVIVTGKQIGRASLGKECLRLCRSRWSPDH